MQLRKPVPPGSTFGPYTVVDELEPIKRLDGHGTVRLFRARCVCGLIYTIRWHNLRRMERRCQECRSWSTT